MMSSETQKRPRPATARQQYPAVDFSRYPSLRQSLITPSYSCYSPSFRASSVCGSKRLRCDGGAWAAAAAVATTITSTSELLTVLAGCRLLSSSTSSSSISCPIGNPGHIVASSIVAGSRTRLAEEVEQDDPPHQPSSVGRYKQEDSLDKEWAAGGEELVDQRDAESDPVDVLARAVFKHILSFLDWRSLGACLAVSRGWNECAKANYLWDAFCKQMLEGKIHVISKALDPAIPRLHAFQISMAEAQRVHIKPADLCHWVWELHYKEHAGEYWRQLDPYYHGLPLMRRIFHEDGHVTAEPMDQIWGGHECSWTLRKSKSMGGAPLVRINHWPPLVVTRTFEWGWKMENAWVVYTSTNISTATGESRQQQ